MRHKKNILFLSFFQLDEWVNSKTSYYIFTFLHFYITKKYY